jgi:hypothetical protein
MFGVPIPRVFAPKISAREWQANDRFQFEVEASMPMIGKVIAYRGWLLPAACQKTQANERRAAA